MEWGTTSKISTGDILRKSVSSVTLSQDVLKTLSDERELKVSGIAGAVEEYSEDSYSEDSDVEQGEPGKASHNEVELTQRENQEKTGRGDALVKQDSQGSEKDSLLSRNIAPLALETKSPLESAAYTSRVPRADSNVSYEERKHYDDSRERVRTISQQSDEFGVNVVEEESVDSGLSTPDSTGLLTPPPPPLKPMVPRGPVLRKVPSLRTDKSRIRYRYNTVEYPSTSRFYSQARKTRIICAIGPSSRDVPTLKKLLGAGMNVARLNFSHGDHEYHGESLRNLRQAIAELNAESKHHQYHCAILLDTKGPEIRTGYLKEGSVELVAQQRLEISTDYSILGDQTRISCNYEALPTSVEEGDVILVADGELSMRVLSTNAGEGVVEVQVENSFRLGERKNMSLPGVTIRLPGITEKDRDDLVNFAVKHRVDIVSGSFIRTRDNVLAIRECLGKEGENIRVHAKIESVEGLMNIEEILQEADGVHISRGDLGMELPLAKLFLAQKYVTKLCNLVGKPVVTSTQMLQSMTDRPRPTHAECTDVANAVLDGTDCVMLSGETASGEYPVAAVVTMSRIIVEAERLIDYHMLYTSIRSQVLERGRMSSLEAMASAAVATAGKLNSRLLVVVSVTGTMALLVAKYRPWARILVVTEEARTARQMSRARGVTSFVVESTAKPKEVWQQVVSVAKTWRWVHKGDRVVMVDTIIDSGRVPGDCKIHNQVGEDRRFDTVKVLQVE